MFRYLLIALLPSTVFALETELRDLADFSQIEVLGSIDVEVRFAESYELVVTAPEGGLAYIETEKSGGDALRISLADGSIRGDYSVLVTTPTLREFELRGSSDAIISDFTTSSLEITLEGSGDIGVGNLILENAEIALLGSGDIRLDSLQTVELELELLGSGDISILQLTAENAEAEILGSGDISVSGSIVDLEIDILGSGDFGGSGLAVERLSGNILGSGDANIGEVSESTLGKSGENLEPFFGRIENEIEFDDDSGESSNWVRAMARDRGTIEGLTGLLAVLLIFGGPVLIVGLVAGFSYRKRKAEFETLRSFAASDRPIPQEVLDALSPKKEAQQPSPKSDLRSGVILIAIGAGIAVVGLMSRRADFLVAVACIPAFIGLAKLFIWKLENGKAE